MKKSKRKSENTDKNDNGNTTFQKSMGCSKSNSKSEVYSDTSLPQKKTRKISDNLTYHLKELEKEQTKPKVSRMRSS